MSDTDIAVANYLLEHNITFKATHVAKTKRDDWECDQWAIIITAPGGRAMSTEYFTGLGHRKWTKRGAQILKIEKYNPHCSAYERLANEHLRPAAPTAASVIHSLLLDASGAEQNFHDWCSAFGADTDSIKSLGTYNACCEILTKVRGMFTAAQRAELQAMLEDY